MGKFLLIISFFIAGTLHLNSASLKELDNLNKDQLKTLYKTFYYGKQHDLHWTLTAIAWKESNFGKYLINPRSKDYGVFQINLKTYKRRYASEIATNNLSDDTIKSYLVRYYDLNAIAAIDELLFWQSVHGKQWTKIWASYNDGTVISSKGRAYSRDIAKRIKLLQHFIGEH